MEPESIHYKTRHFQGSFLLNFLIILLLIINIILYYILLLFLYSLRTMNHLSVGRGFQIKTKKKNSQIFLIFFFYKSCFALSHISCINCRAYRCIFFLCRPILVLFFLFLFFFQVHFHNSMNVCYTMLTSYDDLFCIIIWLVVLIICDVLHAQKLLVRKF